ncbi:MULTISPECIES: type IV toxin-antitoxin system AbiEi family antitoxin domain-containing protein [unclassified Cryobacterium]|uniref:type IV toxin-antitoxin system AbiEi family antitoxin domain-containing protein n=1 Tax=unclassified Cryobacterium TaxID=2649013 RepID=UPI002AB3BC33|nr:MULTISPECIES: type IV toxin-antitoxin system AbiEi family antitoxin domain-containing protein [unclassified Cryobacterium]MDY7541646.1 type IV toxin-antitoxin system AbiEi family antitoxin domain-containing protein [Cryobacterium sp. 5B3]MEA9999026.1 type IV toxin-antitoxin system AbiEi family antitoxin domain-containing protein [Cryobacterium sp. RTS3]MEB0266399.1 type IV toxin-antitoxin system AbiEi family antitoxin domain-containing protein [Cryobacterium sp. 10I5]MEB0275419.1 type IV tox
MTTRLDTLAARYRELIPTGALNAAGLQSTAIDALLRDGTLVRIRRGMFVWGAFWRESDPDNRYRLFVRASAACAIRPLVLSHISAAALHGLPYIGLWPREVHALDPEATGGSHARFLTAHRGASASAPDTVEVAGCTVTSLVRTLVDVAAGTNFLTAVVMIDHALRVEQVRAADDVRLGRAGARAITKDDLLTELALVNPRRGYRQAEAAIDFANPLSANGGESLSRVRLFELGFVVPELQVCFPNVRGHDYWVDFYWRTVRKIGEFDGHQKYTRARILAGRDPAEVVLQEKKREDALREHSDSFMRWDWDLVESPRRFFDFLVEHEVPRAATRPR